MRKCQAGLLAVLACVMALAAGCSSMEPRSGSSADQQRERDNEPNGMRSGGGGGGY